MEVAVAQAGVFGGKDSHPSKPNGKIEGFATDQKLLQVYFREKGIDAQPIATDKFLDKSRDEYNAAWLTRELVQNFVDHNSQHPGTLDGVSFRKKGSFGGTVQFTITGDWPFTDPTGVISPHSEKPNMNTAGGNGIGLKQTAIRFLRDFGVERFNIQGDGWIIEYKLAKAEEVNRDWEKVVGHPTTQPLRHDWLIAHIKEAAKSDRNSYVIETDSPEVIKAMETFPSLGVSSENPHLKNPDYESKHGSIKWLKKEQLGVLFVNGQIMNFKDKGKTSDDYWKGPEGISIRLNDVKYKISIDKPPVSALDLSLYLDGMVHDMAKDDLVEQLKRSEHLWAGHIDAGIYSWEKQGAFILIEKMAGWLPYKGFSEEEYRKHFGGKKYVSLDTTPSTDQLNKLKEQGYIVCPSYFARLGMPRASDILKPPEESYENRRAMLVVKLEEAESEAKRLRAELIELDHKEKPKQTKPAEERSEMETVLDDFRRLPINQPKPPEVKLGGKTIKKDVKLSEPERARIAKMEEQIPGITDTVNELNTLIPESEPSTLSGKTAIEKYLEWRQSDKFYGQLTDNAGYLTGRHLLELIEEQNQAEIDSIEAIREQTPEDENLLSLMSSLKDITWRMAPIEDDVNEFEIVSNPSERNLAQLGLLRLYAQLATGVALPNDLFIYNGTGSKGINLGQKAIGLHEALFNANFTEAMSIFIHEVAHNQASNHEREFMATMEALFATVIGRIQQIAVKSQAGQELTQEESAILDMQRQWDTLRQT